MDGTEIANEAAEHISEQTTLPELTCEQCRTDWGHAEKRIARQLNVILNRLEASEARDKAISLRLDSFEVRVRWCEEMLRTMR
jgi:hypothetical protein